MNEKVYKAIESGNFDGIDTLMADDMVDHDMHTGANVKGKDSVIAMLKGIHSMFKDVKFNVLASSYDAEHGYVMTLVEVSGTTMQADHGMPANTPFSSKSVDVVQVKNGKAVEHWEYTDPIEMMKMMPEHKEMK